MTKKYPLGIQTFSEIAGGDYYYADKTGLVYRLAHYAKFHFLSRPRRFGKSLLVSTLQAYFEGRKELFRGLEIEKLEKSWTAYPVVHFDMSQSKYYDAATLDKALNAQLAAYEAAYGLATDTRDTNSNRLTYIIREAVRQTGRQAVVLVDEYDAPMHDSMGMDSVQDSMRDIMRDFFSPLKKEERNLRFVLITGISKFSQLSIFSELNSLKNISMKDEYAAICGITRDELTTCFSDGIRAMAEHTGMTEEQTLGELKRHYDGYHFSPGGPDIYNPYSIINALDDRDLNNYWFASGTPTFLIKRIGDSNTDLLRLDSLRVKESRFDAPTEKATDPVPVLYQSGYLTIKEYDRRSRLYRLGFPNEEVKQGFAECLVRYYSGNTLASFDDIVLAYADHILANEDMEAFMPHLKAFYDKFPYTVINNNERHYQAVMFTIFAMLGADVSAEQATPDGRIDLVLKTAHAIYIFELKYARPASEAIAQIERKDYARAFAGDRRRTVRVGVSFSANRRSIESWKVE